MEARINGTFDGGALGSIPRLDVDAPRPALHNDGTNSYCGHPALEVDGLGEMLKPVTLPEHMRENWPMRNGHAYLAYSDGQHFLAWAASPDGKVFGFS